MNTISCDISVQLERRISEIKLYISILPYFINMVLFIHNMYNSSSYQFTNKYIHFIK